MRVASVDDVIDDAGDDSGCSERASTVASASSSSSVSARVVGHGRSSTRLELLQHLVGIYMSIDVDCISSMLILDSTGYESRADTTKPLLMPRCQTWDMKMLLLYIVQYGAGTMHLLLSYLLHCNMFSHAARLVVTHIVIYISSQQESACLTTRIFPKYIGD